MPFEFYLVKHKDLQRYQHWTTDTFQKHQLTRFQTFIKLRWNEQYQEVVNIFLF